MRTRKQTRRQRNLIDIVVHAKRVGLHPSSEYEISIQHKSYASTFLGKFTVHGKSNVASSAISHAAAILDTDPGRINIAKLVYA